MSPSEIIFSIVKVIDKVNKHDSINFDTNDELSDFKNDIFQRTIQRVSESDTVRKKTPKQQHTRRRELTRYRSWTSQQKAKIFFRIIIHLEKDTPRHALNLETFYLTLLMWVSIKRTITMRILCSTCTCSLPKI